jgi:hypothetical protein
VDDFTKSWELASKGFNAKFNENVEIIHAYISNISQIEKDALMKKYMDNFNMYNDVKSPIIKGFFSTLKLKIPNTTQFMGYVFASAINLALDMYDSYSHGSWSSTEITFNVIAFFAKTITFVLNYTYGYFLSIIDFLVSAYTTWNRSSKEEEKTEKIQNVSLQDYEKYFSAQTDIKQIVGNLDPFPYGIEMLNDGVARATFIPPSENNIKLDDYIITYDGNKFRHKTITQSIQNNIKNFNWKEIKKKIKEKL